MTTAIILAGGLGTRLRSVVADVPKPMAPVRGEPFLAHLMRYWRGQGVDRFVLSVSYRRQIIMDHFGTVFEGCPVHYAIEDTPLGTGGGLLMALPLIESDEPFLLLNGDTFFAVPLEDLQSFHKSKNADFSFSLFVPQEEGRYLTLERDADERLLAVKATKKEAGGTANGGVYMVSPPILRSCGFRAGDKVSLEDDLFLTLQEQGAAFYGLVSNGAFIDIGVPKDYERADEII